MSQIQTQRQMRVVTVERPMAWVVVAFLVENRNGREVIVSEPKIVKIISKQIFALPAPACKKCVGFASVASPYFSYFSKKEIQNFSLFARPPTK